jgi:hypothetical protein
MSAPLPENAGRDRGLISALLGDGSFLLAMMSVALIAAGGFALFLCVNGHFLPHDVARLGFDARQLALAGNPSLVNFMFHDRAAFGGALVALGGLYLWIVGFPLRDGERWAWWTLLLSGLAGFASFLTYLGFGYFDLWHGVASALLLPFFVAGLWRARLRLSFNAAGSLRQPAWLNHSFAQRCGRGLLLIYGAGLIAGGAKIALVGMSDVFVSTDLTYIGLNRGEICGISDRLTPVIAHDRAGFGGALASTGFAVLGIVWCGRRSRSLSQILFVTAAAGFGAAIGVHYVIGYTNAWHLAPAFLGAGLFGAGWCFLTFGRAEIR